MTESVNRCLILMNRMLCLYSKSRTYRFCYENKYDHEILLESLFVLDYVHDVNE